MPITDREKLERKVDKWIMSLNFDTKEIVLSQLIMRMIETEELRWSDDRKCPYWDSCGEELGENQ